MSPLEQPDPLFYTLIHFTSGLILLKGDYLLSSPLVLD